MVVSTAPTKRTNQRQLSCGVLSFPRLWVLSAGVLPRSMSDGSVPTPPPEAPSAYVHKLSGHAVQGDGTFEEVNDRNRPYEGGAEGARDLPALNEFLEAADVRKKEEPSSTPMDPLPEIPEMPMTVDQAYDFLGVKKEDRGNLDKVKMRFRKMCLKWHPDKNRGREKAAAEVFQACNAAYHFLTTNNFDYKRWAENFQIPPMQTLVEDTHPLQQGQAQVRR